ncbi:MAG: polysaccharide biosynthesis/export family protein [Acidobacteria bacterium]|nr:polysaccharide biosynthesis/export family protein [Acidobacteriota bacterium]MBI3421421.1 polysaccharide biosynthesis/export family protein [Acidobacteriota bacterium]
MKQFGSLREIELFFDRQWSFGRLTLRFVALLAVASCLGLPAWAQQRAPATTKRFDPPPTSNGGGGGNARGPEVIMLSNEDYRMAAKDVIEVTIEDAPELSRNFQINAAGMILMGHLGQIKVAGLTTEELSKQVADGLRGRYLKDPKVSVVVKQYNSRSFFIQGAVRAPGVYMIEGRPTLFRLLTIAGGLQDNHGSTAFVIREKKGAGAKTEPAAANANGNAAGIKAEVNSDEADTQVELITAQISGLFRGQFEQNILIEPGDVVTVPVIDVFYVAGEVNAPGSYPLKEGTTLRQAVALAQGTLFKAASNRAVIFRDDPATGGRKEIPVDVNAVMTGKSKEDPVILANDIIMIPNSRVKSVSQALLQALGTNSMRLPTRF